MKKSFLAIVIVLVLMIGGFIWYMFNSDTKGEPVTIPTQPNNNLIETPTKPTVGETKPVTPTPVPTTTSKKLKLKDNSVIPVPQIIIDTEATTKAPSNVFRDIAGSYDFHYIISYLPYDKENSQIEFNITLNTLPLRQVRLEAESVLRQKLNVTNEELCKMDVSVYVFGWVDQQYAGQNLGLSFCEDAVSLP